MARTYALVDTGTIDLGPVHPGFTGRWFIQVTAYAGLTAITPLMSVDGQTYVTRAITPYNNAADVTTITGTGGWIMDSGGGFARLTGVGTGTATIVVSPAVG